ncbi:Magnesium-protoporphyrin IX monomethyl ester anaerobic oxidative cyclase [Beggiatoa sp. PS]|nr:Magnesium-protoporphyrin IX monomethyl ester anaerobic oxidative cyclase [Beggiatoa sp. PS]
MKVVLVRPPTVLFHGSTLQDIVPPIGLAYLASSLKQAGHEVIGIDALGEGLDEWGKVDGWPEVTRHGLSISELIKKIPADSQLIGVSCMFSATWPYIHQVLQAIREAFPDIPIVVGGEHVTAVPEYILDTCPAVDYCIKGEGESALVMLSNTLYETDDPEEISKRVPGIVLRIDGKAVHGIAAQRIRNVDSIPEPDWTIFPIQIFMDGGYQHGVDRGRAMPILASRGCPYRCTFCSSPQMWTTLWKARTPDAVVNEMKGYIEKYNAENFDFYDLTAIVKKEWIIEFCKKLIEELPPIKWQLPSGTRSEAIDEETAKYMYDSGCCNMIYAPESANIKTLTLIKKKIKTKKYFNFDACGL